MFVQHLRPDLSPDKDLEQLSHQGLDRRRLTRVREYIAANLEGDLTIAQLANVACLSRFHFARAFKTAVGQPPHQYVSAHRLERAKEMLMRGDQPLIAIVPRWILAPTKEELLICCPRRSSHRGTTRKPALVARALRVTISIEP